MDIYNVDALELLKTVDDGTVDLVLTDPPYIISKKSGMDAHYKMVKNNAENGVEFVKTEEDWLAYSATLDKPVEEIEAGRGRGWSKDNYLRYGTILGKKYCNQTDYGDWDKEFTMETLGKVVDEYYRVLRKGGTVIIWFDLWKIGDLRGLMEKSKFKQIRMIEWEKTNPQPINSRVNYLTNAKEIAVLGVKGGKPTFNSSYDVGTYKFPIEGGKHRFHPTQKNTKMFVELVEKHSNPGDLVMDTFLGGGTTAEACFRTGRRFEGCELSDEYIQKLIQKRPHLFEDEESD